MWWFGGPNSARPLGPNLDRVVDRHHGRLCASRMAHQGALHLSGADAVAADLNVI